MGWVWGELGSDMVGGVEVRWVRWVRLDWVGEAEKGLRWGECISEKVPSPLSPLL